MKVELDRELCVGAGQCVLSAPEVFDQDDDGIAVLLTEIPTADTEDQAREAALICPQRAIDIVD